jgi:hypothetical protein
MQTEDKEAIKNLALIYAQTPPKQRKAALAKQINLAHLRNRVQQQPWNPEAPGPVKGPLG